MTRKALAEWIAANPRVAHLLERSREHVMDSINFSSGFDSQDFDDFNFKLKCAESLRLFLEEERQCPTIL